MVLGREVLKCLTTPIAMNNCVPNLTFTEILPITETKVSAFEDEGRLLAVPEKTH